MLKKVIFWGGDGGWYIVIYKCIQNFSSILYFSTFFIAAYDLASNFLTGINNFP